MRLDCLGSQGECEMCKVVVISDLITFGFISNVKESLQPGDHPPCCRSAASSPRLQNSLRHENDSKQYFARKKQKQKNKQNVILNWFEPKSCNKPLKLGKPGGAPPLQSYSAFRTSCCPYESHGKRMFIIKSTDFYDIRFLPRLGFLWPHL